MDVKKATLAEFLLACIAKDEAIARTATAGPWTVDEQGCCVASEAEGIIIETHGFDTAASHAAHWEPVRVLAECEAKRRIVEFHSPSRHPLNLLADRRPDRYSQKREDLGLVCEECSGHDDPYIDQEPWPCRTLAALALPYADHSDYREEWRP
jgi:hypothetical protein